MCVCVRVMEQTWKVQAIVGSLRECCGWYIILERKNDRGKNVKTPRWKNENNRATLQMKKKRRTALVNWHWVLPRWIDG